MPIVVSYVDRSGSTVLENILLELKFPVKFFARAENDASIICMRDIRDIIVSHKRVEMSSVGKQTEFIHRKMTKEEIEEYLNPKNRIRRQLTGLAGIVSRNPKIEIWKYENWFNNYNWIFNRVEHLPWGRKIEKKEREEITKKYSLKAVRKLIKDDKDLVNFTKWKKPHMFHGDHIWRGEPGSWKRLVPVEYHTWFTNLVKEDLKLWGYYKYRFSDEDLYGERKQNG